MKNKISPKVIWSVAFVLGAGMASNGLAQEFGPVPKAEADAAQAELGKRLYFDPRLSGDAAIICSTCHNPEKGFADG